jgi:hypothetical protein
VSVEEKPLFWFLKKEETRKSVREVELFLLVLNSIYGFVMSRNTVV